MGPQRSLPRRLRSCRRQQSRLQQHPRLCDVRSGSTTPTTGPARPAVDGGFGAKRPGRQTFGRRRLPRVAEAVADGRAEIGNTNLTELLPHKGVKVIGPIPEPLGLVITYVGGISSASTNREAARAFLAALTSPAAREKFKAAGL
jgi:hypothetical protein